ncbi:NfeD family protein [Amphiplicatus metriothermophilus]|uniref:Membrane-bound serine protease (ClpP class) n=1 Tax=Amphiplicatus metriothermophilus TaxID=1519374 RepID=A0A239PK73_9PROT|nr:nodulation protein NfeD [Amphiplicatus metriothermophilus]MBB5517716.1 membrane-bound serine protease (ClpP class) [Amphiplicatus metriothermophilus]SNT67950.1 membrane-bound serine protease (ClpP class) [Amphiplicatus metriothermophilus]
MKHGRGKAARLGFFAALVAAGLGLLGLSALAQNEVGEAGPDAAARKGVLLSLTGPVTPANARYLAREIGAASAAGKEVVVIEIDTPGGLMDSMKTIIKAILASETPVATYVSPQGARSASAGLYIMYAAHVSAMAPSTNTGAATPVEIGGAPSEDNPFEEPAPRESAPEDQQGEGESDGESSAPEESPAGGRTLSNEGAMRAKVINDAAAYIRSLAEERGRNADWAERAVREGISATSREALDLGVIDLIAEDIDDLLAQMDGRSVKVASGEKTLRTKDLLLERVEPTMIEKILGFIADPNVAVILMSLGTTGIIIEMWNPGSIFPGLLGLTCLILGLYSFQVLPYNWLGLVLMGAGALFMMIEAYTPTFGLAGLSGLLLFGFGLFVIFPEGFKVSPAVIGTMLAIVGALLAAVLVAFVGSRSHGPLIGTEAIRRREGIVDDWDGKEGHVIVEGERWRARCDKPLKKGDRVRVVEVDGLVLVVRQAKGQGLLGGLVAGEAG